MGKPGPRHDWKNPFHAIVGWDMFGKADVAIVWLTILANCDPVGETTASNAYLIRASGIDDKRFHAAISELKKMGKIDGDGHWHDQQRLDWTYFVNDFDELLAATGNIRGYYRQRRARA
jgi:hypothetical protein